MEEKDRFGFNKLKNKTLTKVKAEDRKKSDPCLFSKKSKKGPQKV